MVATPFLCDSFIHYSMPVYPDAIQARRPILPDRIDKLTGLRRSRAVLHAENGWPEPI